VGRTPIHLKLAATLAVPIIVLAVATTFGVRVASHERAAVRRQTELARAAIGPAGVLSTLQNERIWVAIDMLEFTSSFTTLPVDSYDEAFGQTDAAVADLRDRVSGTRDVIADAFAGPMGGLDDLAQLRADIDAFRAGTNDNTAKIEFTFDVWDRYTALLAPFYDATTSIVGEISDARLREGARMSDSVSRSIEAFSRLGERTVVIALLTENGVDTRDEIVELSRLRATLDRHATAMGSAPAPYSEIPTLAESQQMIEGVETQVEEALTTGRFAMDNLWDAIAQPQGQGLFALQDDVHSIINARADLLEARAETRQLRLVTLGLVGMAFVILLNLLVSRSITRPLRSLTHQAKDVAQRRLPAAVAGMLELSPGGDVPVPEVEPVTVDSGDELAAVAVALNTVQTSVVDLAARQAVYRRNISDLFVSLNGRNQDLLQRQVGLIGRLDSPLAAPTTQASRLQLDHLATQVRRNTESLLAVAGVDARRVWQAPVDIHEMVGYALAEVSDSRRTVVHQLEPAAVAGAAASDVVHLLAELIESALELSAGSAEGRPVELRGGPKPETGGYWLAVIDFGAVLTPHEVTVANRQLTGDESAPTVGPSSPGGHAVAGHLAKRAGVAVHLDSSAGWGVTTTIELPGDLIIRPLSAPDSLSTSPPSSLAAAPPPAAPSGSLPGSPPAPATHARPLAGTTMAPLPPRHRA
jgi:methyl-accepting chemotaxis protein